MKPSCADRLVDVMEELMKFTLLLRSPGLLVDRYSERKSPPELSKRVNQRSILTSARKRYEPDHDHHNPECGTSRNTELIRNSGEETDWVIGTDPA